MCVLSLSVLYGYSSDSYNNLPVSRKLPDL